MGRNPASAEDFRDQLFCVRGPPYSIEHRIPGPRLQMRYAGQITCQDGTQLLSEWRWKDRRLRTWVLPTKPSEDSEENASLEDRWLLYDRNFEDKYNDPGDFQL